MIKIYTVNLPRCQERRQHILTECARFGLTTEILPGIDGNNLTEADLHEVLFAPNRNMLTPPEVGCALSHLEIYKDILKQNHISYALILEDDSIFKTDPRPLLRDLESLKIGTPDVYLLTHRKNRYICGKEREIGDTRFYRGWDGYGANGYIISRSAAGNLLRFQTPLKCVCDCWKFFQRNNIISFYVSEKEIIGLHSKLGSISESLIEEARRSRFNSNKNHIYRHLRRGISLTPWLKMKYLFSAGWNFRNIRHQ